MGSNNCELFGLFGFVVQMGLGILSFSILICSLNLHLFTYRGSRVQRKCLQRHRQSSKN